MKSDDKERKNMMVSLRMPADVVEDLKRVAPLKGMSGYQALYRVAGKGENGGA
jgi:hypothetical protein